VPARFAALPGRCSLTAARCRRKRAPAAGRGPRPAADGRLTDTLEPMTGLRWGILATGGIAHAFASDLRTAGLDLVAVGSRSQQSADAFAAEFDIPRAHASYEALVTDPDVDIIYVSTPHPMHKDGARLALEHGKHVLVEKPFTVNRAEAEALQQLAAGRGLLAMEAMWSRYLPHMVR